MASNGDATKSSKKVADTVMVDASDDSPFAVFNQPKVELFDAASAAPTVAASSKPRFEPKVKPRASSTRPRASNSSKPPTALPPGSQASAHPSSKSSEARVVPAPDPLEQPKGEPPAQPMVAVKEEIPDLKPEPILEEMANVKIEPELEVDVKPDLNVGSGEALLSPKAEEEQPVNREPGEDRVVREIDVLLSRSVEPDTQFYLLQYPLRPAWRPYDVEEQCQEVRVKAKQKKLEMDLAIDTNNENYDEDVSERIKIKTQTLSSSKVSLTTSYAIGVLQGNKLHLNPLQAVVQLRPSMKHLDVAEEEKKKEAPSGAGVGGNGDEEMEDAEAVPEGGASELVALQVNVRRRETEWQEESRLQSHAYLKQLDDAEPWIALEPHGVDSPDTEGIRRKMIASTTSQIPFNLRPDEYVDKLVPGQGIVSLTDMVSGDGSESAGFSRCFLDTLPLDRRFHLLFSKGRVQVLQFERLIKLAPQDCTEQDLLNVLQEKAVLVQGCWVVASNLRYSKPTATIRDYLLLLFTKSRVVQRSQFEGLRISKETLREILLSFAVQNGVTASWEFQEDTDRTFIKRHQAVVKEQAQKWMGMEARLLDEVKGLDLTGAPKLKLSVAKEVPLRTKPPAGILKSPKASDKAKGVHFKFADDGSGDPGQTSQTVSSSGHGSLSEATLSALPRALNIIFQKHSVCRIQFICQTLRERAIDAAGGSSKDPSRNLGVAEAKAAAQAAAAPLPELEAAVSTVAANIDGVYFLNSLNNPTLDPFRNVVIALLRAKGPGSGLRKTDIMEASKIALKTEVPQTTYQKVLKELCYTKGGAWVLKPGDGRPT